MKRGAASRGLSPTRALSDFLCPLRCPIHHLHTSGGRTSANSQLIRAGAAGNPVTWAGVHAASGARAPFLPGTYSHHVFTPGVSSRVADTFLRLRLSCPPQNPRLEILAPTNASGSPCHPANLITGGKGMFALRALYTVIQPCVYSQPVLSPHIVFKWPILPSSEHSGDKGLIADTGYGLGGASPPHNPQTTFPIPYLRRSPIPYLRWQRHHRRHGVWRGGCLHGPRHKLGRCDQFRAARAGWSRGCYTSQL